MEYLKINSKNPKFELYLNMVGGHAFIINMGNGKIIKSSSKNEINFYETYKNFNFEYYDFFPKYFGKIENEVKEFDCIEKFLIECDSVFNYFIANYNFENLEINLEEDQEFDSKLEKIRKLKEILKNQNFAKNSMKILGEELITMNPEKLKWILFWFVKWRDSFFKYDYVILEDLTYKMTLPAIMDLKLGFNKHFCSKYKMKQGSDKFFDSGLRIMGIQVIFKNLKFY